MSNNDAVGQIGLKEKDLEATTHERNKVTKKYQDRITEAIGSSDKKIKRLFKNFDNLDYGLIMDVELKYTGRCSTFIRKDGKSIFLSGTQAIKQMKLAYNYSDIDSACGIAGVIREGNRTLTWRNKDFKDVLIKFFILLASHVKMGFLDNQKDMTEEQTLVIEELAVDGICNVLHEQK